MVNQNQNQNLNKLLDQSFQKKSAMEQGIGAGTPQASVMPQASKAKKAGLRSGILIKVFITVLFVLVLGLGALWYIFYSDIDSKNTEQDNMLLNNQNLINALSDRVDLIEGGLSNIDTFSQKVEAIEAELDKYSSKEDLMPIMEYLKKQDSDRDGLSDYEEIVLYKSDPFKKDTDGDGFDDKAEVDAGYNPAGPGRLEDQNLTQEEKEIILGDWSGTLSSEVARSSEFTLNFTDNNRINGELVFPGREQNILYKSRVTGFYIFNKDDNRFSATLINNFSVIDNSSADSAFTEKEYKMNINGNFSSETRQIIGTWNIQGDFPANWPAASSGTFTINKTQEQASVKLDDSKDEEVEAVAPAQTISVKAFSFGFSPTAINLIRGQRTTLELTSLDVAHTLTSDELDIDMRVQGGETVSIEYTPVEVGEYEYYCSIPGHKEAGMVGKIIVQEEAK